MRKMKLAIAVVVTITVVSIGILFPIVVANSQVHKQSVNLGGNATLQPNNATSSTLPSVSMPALVVSCHGNETIAFLIRGKSNSTVTNSALLSELGSRCVNNQLVSTNQTILGPSPNWNITK